MKVCLRKRSVWLQVVLALVALAVTTLPANAVSWGQRAPAFTLTDISGKPTTLTDLLRSHQAVVLAIGTAWSYQFPHWMQELQRLADRYTEGRVAVAAVFLKDRPQRVRLFAHRHGLTRGRVLLLVDSTGSLIKPYGLKEIPRLLLLDRAGTIHYDGPPDHIDDSVARLLRGEAVPPQTAKPRFTKPSQGH